MNTKRNTEELLLGIDSGTSTIQCVLYDFEGNRVACREKRNSVIAPEDGRKEQDMALLWEDISETVKGLIETGNISPDRIKAVGLSGQGEGCWLIDKEGEPVTNAVLWCDNRAKAIAENIEKDEFLLSSYRRITGSFPFSGAQIVILKWLMENEAHYLKKAAHVFFCKDWIRFKLTGSAAIEYTDASTSVLDLGNKEIAEELFDLLDIEPCLNLVPELKTSSEIAGFVTEEAATKTGLRRGTPVVSGAMDIAATALGAGALHPNDCCTILGTTSCNEVVTPEFNPEEDKVDGYEIDGRNKYYLNVMASMSGTLNLDWFIEEFLKDISLRSERENFNIYAYLDEEVRKIPAGSGGLIYHPYISPSGERSPFLDSNARAQFFGISSGTTRFHFLRALYEGVAYSVRDNIENSPKVETIFLTGGGARSSVWSRIISDVTGKEVYRIRDTDLAAKGAAFLAGIGAGVFSEEENVWEQTGEKGERIFPDEKHHRLYTEFFEIYLELRRQNSLLWNKRNQIMKRTKNLL